MFIIAHFTLIMKETKMAGKSKITKDLLHYLYIIEGKNQSEIANTYNVSRATIRQHLKKHGLHKPRKTVSKEILEELYIKKDYSTRKIAKILNASSSSVHYFVQQYRLNKKTWKEKLTADILYDLYVIQKKTAKQISEEFDCSLNTVKGLLCRNKISKSKPEIREDCTIRIARKDKHGMWSGYKDISGSLWNHIKLSAKNRNLNFDITIKQIWDLFIKQGKKCALTGHPLDFNNNQYDNNDISGVPSLDRIDSSKGYTVDNIQWVLKEVNFMKHVHNNNVFIKICIMVANNQKDKNNDRI